MPREITYFEAVFEAEREEMTRDERVILIGEDLGLYEKTGLLSGIGPERIRSAPISENGFVGVAVGAAMTGLRPIVDLTIASFCFVAADQLVNQAAKSRYMFGGQAEVPLVVRSAMWHGGSNAAHHSDRPYPMFMNVPGLKIAVPATPYDAKGLLKAAIRDDDPVLLFEDKNLWFRPGPVPDEDTVVPLGVADVRREGGDATVVAVGATVGPALEAAEELSAEGCSAEVIDPRTLVPLDRRTILESVVKTGRLVVVDLANKTCGAAAEIAAIAAEEVFDALAAPIVRVTTPDVHIPFSPPLEKTLYPDKDDIVAALRRVLAR
jgi:pyruvate dehydrogenase E1 component beta subunit